MASHPWLRSALVGLLTLIAMAGEAQSTLTLSLSPSGNPVTFTRKESDVVIAFTVDSSANVETADIRLRIIPFVDEQGRPAESTSLVVDGKPPDPESFPLPAFGHLPVQVEAKLPRAGSTYTAYLLLSQAGKPQATVTLTVQRPAATVTLRDIPAMRVDSGRVTVPLTIQETPGETQVKSLELVGLTRDTGEPIKPGADASWTFLEDGKELETPFTLQGRRHLDLRLQGLSWPGKYEGTVSLDHGDRYQTQTVEKGLTVYSRWPALVTFVLIAFGVMVSWLLRKYLAEGRPRLVEEQRGELLLQDLQGSLPPGDLDPREQSLVQALRGQIGRAMGLLETGGDMAAVKAALDLLASKVPLVAPWVLLRRQVRELEPPELRVKPQETLNGVERTLLDPAATAQAVTDAAGKLRNLPGDIETLVRDHLSGSIQKLDEQMAATRQQAGATLATVLSAQVAPRLEQARQAMAEASPEEAARAVGEAWSAYASALAAELDRVLAGTKPAGLEDGEWQDLRDRATAALAPARQTGIDPERAVAAVRVAQTIYFEGLATALTRRIGTALAAVQDDTAQKTWMETLQKIRGQLQEGLTRLAEGKLDEAGRRISEAHAAFLLAASQGKGMQLSAGAALPEALRAPTPAGLLPRLRFTLMGALEIRQPSAAPASASARLKRYDLWANAAIVLIAALLGIPVLWSADPAWGGFQDSLTAVLWGLGLHQFAFTGVKGLMEKLTA